MLLVAEDFAPGERVGQRPVKVSYRHPGLLQVLGRGRLNRRLVRCPRCLLPRIRKRVGVLPEPTVVGVLLTEWSECVFDIPYDVGRLAQQLVGETRVTAADGFGVSGRHQREQSSEKRPIVEGMLSGELLHLKELARRKGGIAVHFGTVAVGNDSRHRFSSRPRRASYDAIIQQPPHSRLWHSRCERIQKVRLNRLTATAQQTSASKSYGGRRRRPKRLSLRSLDQSGHKPRSERGLSQAVILSGSGLCRLRAQPTP